MTQEEAIAKARKVAEEAGFPWHEIVSARLTRKSYPEERLFDGVRRIFGVHVEERHERDVWEVSTGWDVPENFSLHVPCTIIVIDDETGMVFQKFHQPR